MIVLDSGLLVAAANQKDPNHLAAVTFFGGSPEPLIVPVLVVAEAVYMISKVLGPRAESAFLRTIPQVRIDCPLPEDWARIAELVETYQDFPLGNVDAAVIALAEKLHTFKIATFDHRHFRVVRPNHISHFTLLPE